MENKVKHIANKVITRSDLAYESCKRGWNRGIEWNPLAIVYCQNEEDIKRTLHFVKEHNLDMRIRSGGHHYEGYSSGENVIILDVNEMNKISIDEQEKRVIIQGGVRNEALYKALGERGYPFPGGGCPTVGVAGLTLGGGWGYSARFLGLAADSLLAVTLIDANGERLTASEANHPDLFWALKGAGGGQFGVVTELTYRLPEKVQRATWIHLDFKECTLEEKIRIVATWQEAFQTMAPCLNLKMSVYNGNKRGKGVFMTGICYGDEVLTRQLLTPFTSLGSQHVLQLEEAPMVRVNQIIQDSHPPYEKYKSNGRFLRRLLTSQELAHLVGLLESKPKEADYTALSWYGMGGKIGTLPKESSSFYYRDAQAIIGLQAVWEEQECATACRKWVLQGLEEVTKYTEGAFVNFPLAELEDYETAYFGGHKTQLREIKKKYDPENVFSFPQSIGCNNDSDQ